MAAGSGNSAADVLTQLIFSAASNLFSDQQGNKADDTINITSTTSTGAGLMPMPTSELSTEWSYIAAVPQLYILMY